MAVILQRVFFCLFLVACDANQFLLQVEVAECYCELVLGLIGGARQFLFKISFFGRAAPPRAVFALGFSERVDNAQASCYVSVRAAFF